MIGHPHALDGKLMPLRKLGILKVFDLLGRPMKDEGDVGHQLHHLLPLVA